MALADIYKLLINVNKEDGLTIFYVVVVVLTIVFSCIEMKYNYRI